MPENPDDDFTTAFRALRHDGHAGRRQPDGSLALHQRYFGLLIAGERGQ